MRRTHTLRKGSCVIGPLEHRILEFVWEYGSSTARELNEAECVDLAHNTIKTTLDRLFKKRILWRELKGRAYRYTPHLTREEFFTELAGHALRRMFQSSPASASLSHLVYVLSRHDARLLKALSELIEEQQRRLRDHEAKAIE
jgi:predicted transcriptional regulator